MIFACYTKTSNLLSCRGVILQIGSPVAPVRAIQGVILRDGITASGYTPSVDIDGVSNYKIQQFHSPAAYIFHLFPGLSIAVVQRMERMIKIMRHGFEFCLCENGLHENTIVRSELSMMNREPSEFRRN